MVNYVAKRRKAVPVTLTAYQREQLERLWFYYGNYGPETTPGNHSFIQRLLENGVDERPLHTRRTPKSERPMPECEAAVEAVLAMEKGSRSGGQDGQSGGLRVINDDVELRRSEVDTEMKAVLDSPSRQRYGYERSRPGKKNSATSRRRHHPFLVSAALLLNSVC
jgi:hypothetical protein